MSRPAEPSLRIGEVYIMLSTVQNPFDKVFAKVIDLKSGYVQFRKGTSEDYCPGKATSKTVADFMELFGPL